MSVHGDLFTRIGAVSAITALLGSNPVRFRWQQVPEGETKPYTRYFQVSENRSRGHDGPAGHTVVRMQVEHYDDNPDDCLSLAAAFRALDGTESGNVKMLLVDQGDAFQPDTNLWQVRQDWLIHHKES